MDVKSLYTVIPHADGLKALKYYLNLRSTQFPPTEALLRLAELVLTLNNFEFNSEYYDQIRGVSMGTKFGPTYACIFMGYIEQQFLSQYVGPIPEFLHRYIDDIFGYTLMPKNHLQQFIDDFNDFHPAIDFTYVVSESKVTFLDVEVHSNNNQIETTIHYKQTDSHSYLDYSSNHPTACKNGIPFGQFLRLRRICSNEADFRDKSREMTNFFLERGYSKAIVSRANIKCSAITRADALKSAKKLKVSKIPLVLTYDKVNQQIASIVQKQFKSLSRDPEMVPYSRTIWSRASVTPTI